MAFVLIWFVNILCVFGSTWDSSINVVDKRRGEGVEERFSKDLASEAHGSRVHDPG